MKKKYIIPSLRVRELLGESFMITSEKIDIHTGVENEVEGIEAQGRNNNRNTNIWDQGW